jgi:hemolysin D
MLRTQQTTLAQENGQIAEIEANLEVISRDSKKTLRSFIADNTQKLDEAERQVASLTEKLAHADAHISNLIIKSPIEGTVQSSIVTTAGQVVSQGEELM